VGVSRLLTEAGLYVALERGYFQQEGISIELTVAGSGVEAMQFLAGGQIDLALAGITAAFFNALHRGVLVKLVAPGDTYYPGASTVFLMVRNELLDRGAIADYADLAGHRVAVSARGTFSHYLLGLALGRAGLTMDAVDLVELPLTDINAGLASGAVSAAIQIEPSATLSAEQGIAAKWRSAGDIRPGLIGGGYFYSADLLGRRRDVGARWMVAYLKGVRDYNAMLQGPAGREEIAMTLARYTAVTDVSLYARMALPQFSPNGDVDLAGFENQLRWYVDQAVVPAGLDPSLAVDSSFAGLAVQQLGRIPEGSGQLLGSSAS
jgi:NitT/TauT family transport system substrate-binding protein